MIVLAPSRWRTKPTARQPRKAAPMSKRSNLRLSSRSDKESVQVPMERSWSNRWFTLLLVAAASGLLLASLTLPLWQMRLEAPQYRDKEALHIAVHPNALRGDLKELTVLDQYIGVHVPSTLPQFKWLPGLLIGGSALGGIGGLLRKPLSGRALTLVSSALTVALAVAAIQAMAQIRDIGHKRDQKTVLAGVKDFTPPFLGTTKIAQFTVSSRFGIGAWFIGGALTLQLGAAWLSRRSQPKTCSCEHPTVENDNRLFAVASH